MSAFDAERWPADMLHDVSVDWKDRSKGTCKELVFDWKYAFGEAKLDPELVARIEKHVDGENDERDWICFGTLTDGRWFVLHAGCDYTGWDCQASGDFDTAATREELIALKMTSEQRTALLDAPADEVTS